MVMYFAEGRVGVKRRLCSWSVVNGSELSVRCISNALSVLRNDLKLYDTERTGSDCSGEKRTKSTAIQVFLNQLWSVFQCTHHPPRARSRITQDRVWQEPIKFSFFSEKN
ncbi:hypothetical protein MalM14_45450 [Gimesia chilikensis]|jgi:hypothetical protein|nr:hypothetical protein MalM14_45450 [Gimesia chilikensis]